MELLQNNILPNSFIELKDKMLQGTFLYLSLFLPVCSFSSLFWSVRYNAFISILLALFNEFFRGLPVAHPGKNPVWFVFRCISCMNKLESQPIDYLKSWSIISSSRPTNGIVQNLYRFLIDLLPLKNVSGCSLPNLSLVMFRMAF